MTINYGLSINSFEIGLYNGNPSINYIDNNYISKQLEFILTPNTASPNGNLFKYSVSNITPSNMDFTPDFNKTNNITNLNITKPPTSINTIFEIPENTLQIGHYIFTVLYLSIDGQLPNGNNYPGLLWRNNIGYNCILFWGSSMGDGFMLYVTPFNFKLV